MVNPRHALIIGGTGMLAGVIQQIIAATNDRIIGQLHPYSNRPC